MDAISVAEDAISLFLEYRDKYGYPEDVAQVMAMDEVKESLYGYYTIINEYPTPEDFEDGTPLVPVDTDDLPF